MRYIIEDTAEGFKITARAASAGISLETAGGHDELEELYAHAERAWDAVRRQYSDQIMRQARSAETEGSQ